MRVGNFSVMFLLQIGLNVIEKFVLSLVSMQVWNPVF